MKTVLNMKHKLFVVALMLIASFNILWAQDVKAEIKGEDVGSWFSQNWLWVAGAVVLLLVIILLSSGSRRSRVTTTTTNRNGHLQRTTTTEEEVD
jgi:membrane protein implicated in regulation of membrane protease activity